MKSIFFLFLATAMFCCKNSNVNTREKGCQYIFIDGKKYFIKKSKTDKTDTILIDTTYRHNNRIKIN